VTIPEDGKIESTEFGRMVQVRLRLFLGSGKILAAQVVPRPDKIGMMQKMRRWI
jgi:hypothetical protein